MPFPTAQAMAARAADWRSGSVVYQVFLDRFAPSRDLEAKRQLYAPPRRLRPWDSQPRRGRYLPELGVWSHELEFWGGDLASLRGKLDYVQDLGAEVLYLNPIFRALTNHGYDTWDYHQVDPVYGSREELKALADELHRRDMRLVLDGVFNHMGRGSPAFQEALCDPDSPERQRFFFESALPLGYRAWADVPNLPALNLERPAVQQWLFQGPESVMGSYLARGEADGWRLDVAFELGHQLLERMTRAAHAQRPDALVAGEIWNYPASWFPAVDGLLNLHARELLLAMVQGRLDGPSVGRMWASMVQDCGIEPLLRSWLVLDNHDTRRLPAVLPRAWQRRMARALQLSLPGAPCLYYGSERGMGGGDDPENRAPMRWEAPSGTAWALHKELLGLRRRQAALRHGDFVPLESRHCLAFLRTTHRAADTVLVLANPQDRKLDELLQLRDGRLQNTTVMRDLLSRRQGTVHAGTLCLQVPPRRVLWLKPEVGPTRGGYSRYARMA